VYSYKPPQYLLILLLGLVSFAIYSNSLQGEFLIDDYQAILRNPRLHSPQPYLKKELNLGIGWGALWDLSHVLIWRFWGPRSFYYHLFNVLAHVACVALLFVLCQSLFSNPALSFLTSLIFALHPIHTEAISWISGGHYAFSAVFFIATLWAYVKSGQGIFYFLLTALFFALCVASGNAAVPLPIVFIIYDLFFREKEPPRLRRLRLIILPAIILTAFLGAGVFFARRNKFIHTIFYFRGASYLVVITKAIGY